MSAPLPCCINTNPMIEHAVKTCKTRIATSTSISTFPRLPWPDSGAANRHKFTGLQRGPTDQPTVDIAHREKLCCVVGLDTATIKKRHVARVDFPQARPQHAVHFLRLLRRCRTTRSYGPHRLLRNHPRRPLLTYPSDHR